MKSGCVPLLLSWVSHTAPLPLRTIVLFQMLTRSVPVTRMPSKALPVITLLATVATDEISSTTPQRLPSRMLLFNTLMS